MSDGDHPIQLLLQRAQQLVDAEDFAGARAAFTQLRDMLPQHPMPLLSRCTCFLQEERWEEAIPDALAILALPDAPLEEGIANNCSTYHSAACVRLAKAYHELGRQEECQRFMARRKDIEAAAEAKLPATDAVDQAEVQRLKAEGNRCYQRGEYEPAILAYCQAVKLDPKNHLLHSNACQAMLQINRLSEARYHAEQCTILRPEWPKGFYRLGTVLSKLGAYDKATKALETAVELSQQQQQQQQQSVDSAITDALDEARKQQQQQQTRKNSVVEKHVKPAAINLVYTLLIAVASAVIGMAVVKGVTYFQ